MRHSLTLEQFLAKGLLDPRTGCLEWQGHIDKRGYALCKWRGYSETVQKVAWILSNGPVPKGHKVKRSCGNKACFSPAHLVIKTPDLLSLRVVACRAKQRERENEELRRVG